MNTLPAVVSHILAVLAADVGTFDFSAQDAVKEGTYLQPPTSAPSGFACLTPPAQTGSEPWGRGPDWYVETYAAEIRAWAPVTDSTTDERAERARLLASEIKVALDNARVVPGPGLWRCVTFRVASVVPDPAGATSLPGWARAVLTVEFTFRRSTGTGA